MKQNPYPHSAECDAFANLVPIASLHILTPTEMTLVESHLVACPHCRYERAVHNDIDQALRDTLRRQQEMVRPFSHAEFVQLLTHPADHAMRSIHMTEPTGYQSHSQRRQFVLAAIVVAVVVTVLAVLIFPWRQHTPARYTSAVTAPYPTAAQAWGSAASHTIQVGNIIIDQSTPPSMTPAFTPTDISPDGALIVGYALNPGMDTATVIAVKSATGAQQQLATVPTAFNIAIVTDGRYIAWGENGPQTFQPPHGQISYFDTQTKKTNTFSTMHQSSSLFLEQGHLLWPEQTSVSTAPSQNVTQFILKDTDLSSGQTRNLLPSTMDQIQGVCWPNVIYDNTIVNALTGAHVPLLLPTPQATINFNITVAICNGTTAYASFGTFQNRVQGMGVIEADDLTQTPLIWTKENIIPGIAARLVGADNRLIIFAGQGGITSTGESLAWDRQQQRLVFLSADFANSTPRPSQPLLRGHWLVYLTAHAGKTILNIVDTTHLR